MMTKTAGRFVRDVLVVGCLLATLIGVSSVQAAESVVRAVLFYSPTCPHCHKVITEDLPPLIEEYGARLEIVGVDTSDPQGDALYEAAVERFQIPYDRRGVPALIVGETVLVGSQEIPDLLPSLIEELLAEGGAGWPDIPGLADALSPEETAPAGSAPPGTSVPSAAPSPTTAAEAGPATAAPTPGLPAQLDPASDPFDNLARDPVGNGLAVAVLVGMLGALAWTVLAMKRAGSGLVARMPSLAIPVLSVVGLGVAAYLAYAETAQVTAVCGPVGDCNTVQQSPYAWLFGVFPIGLLGIVGYLLIIAAWAAGRFGPPSLVQAARLGLLAMTVAGTAFSIYLTFLEPFVIGATCAWCLTSAVLMTLLMLIAVRSMAILPAPAPAPGPGPGPGPDPASATA